MRVLSQLLFVFWVCHSDLSCTDVWGEYGNVTVSECLGRCGTGKILTTMSRTCCAGEDQCEYGSAESSSSEKCDTGRVCKSTDWKEYDGFQCQGAPEEVTYLGRVFSEGECETLAKANSKGFESFMLECIGDNDYDSVACYGCETTSIKASDCGSKAFAEKDWTWNYVIMGIGLGVAFMVLIGSMILTAVGVEDDKQREYDDEAINDELRIEMDDKLCECCPAFFTLSTGTTVFCFMGFALGAILGVILDGANDKQRSDWLKVIYYPGEIWINILKLIVTPMIALMMITLPDRVDLLRSRIGLHLFGFYVFTSTIAACEGLIWVNIIQPGDVSLFISFDDATVNNSLTEIDSLLGIGRKAFPKSLFGALVDGNILGVIVFFLSLGVLLQTDAILPQWRRPVIDGSKACLKAIMLSIPTLIKFTPFAMLCIVANKVADIDNLELLMKTEALYILTVIVAQSIHAFMFYPLILFLFTKTNGWAYFSSIRKAPFTAFATSSSAATLPVTIETLRSYGTHPSITDFIAPVGSAINMDGTSCGFPIMVLFTAQLVDYKLSAGSQITVALLAITCSIGTAPIPNAGIVYLTMLFTAAGGRLAEDDVIALGLAMIVILDWFVDRVETAQNVWSDCCACKIFDEWGYGDEIQKKEAPINDGEYQVKRHAGTDQEEDTPVIDELTVKADL